MDVLGPLPKTMEGNRFMVVIKDRYNKITKEFPTTKTYAITVARIFLKLWVANYGIRFRLLTDNGPQFASKFFVAVCSTLWVNNSTVTEYHPQTNGKAERFNATLILQL